MGLRRIALAPFAWLYGAGLVMRHALYDLGIRRSIRPTLPTIAIGNLALGGTGKTPMLELILRTLHDVAPLAALSRGYGRSGTGILEVQGTDTATRSGDEPLQVKRKFPEARVFVGADRVGAIARIQQDVPDVKAVVLDDALQHRRLDAGLSILLTTWQRPWCDDALLPAGRLRDLPSRRKVAQVIVVTKCPSLPSQKDQARWRERLGLPEGQELFFAGIEYEELSAVGSQLFVAQSAQPDNGQRTTSRILLFTGIENPQPLLEHLQRTSTLEHIAFPDHHLFTRADLERLARRFDTFAPGPKTLVTTEKDAARLGSLKGTPLEGLPLATIGMRAVILNEPDHFADLIRRHVATHPAHR
ncbi:MAG: tetraacyldisaccharide 4'-kinase [Flavobacteriales bacterium]|nr:tetraacyldisaccharide 4'-kinase [Flavobacteriales bacterium]